MTARPITLIDENRPCAVDAVVDGETIRLAPTALERALGWQLKPQGSVAPIGAFRFGIASRSWTTTGSTWPRSRDY